MSDSRGVALALVLVACGGRTDLASQTGGAVSVGGGASVSTGAGGGSAVSSGAGGASCVDAVLATGATGAVAPILHLGDAYWATPEGEIWRQRAGEGEAVRLVGGLPSGMDLAVHGAGVFYTAGNTVGRYSEANDEVEVIATEQQIPFSPAVVGDRLYWLNRGAGILSGQVMRLSPSGTIEPVLGDLGQPTALEVDESHAYVLVKTALLDGEFHEGALLRVEHDTLTVEVLESGLPEPAGMALTESRVFWIEQVSATFSYPGHLVMRDKARGSPLEVLATIDDALGLTVSADDGAAAYTVFSSDGSFARYVDLGSGDDTLLAEQPAQVAGLVAMGQSHVLLTATWSAGAQPDDTPAVSRLCRPRSR